MGTVSIKELISEGLHFGHAASSWNPKMKPFIYGTKKKAHIIDLKYTVKGIVSAIHFVNQMASQGKRFMFVGTKAQASSIIEEVAKATGSFYVNQRWLGGMLTNHQVILSRIRHMIELEQIDASDNPGYSKKVLASIKRNLKKLHRDLDGVRDMTNLPDVFIVIDPTYEETAVHEAQICHIPVLGLADTNSDPDLVDLLVPGNDDSARGIRLFLYKLRDAILEGRANPIDCKNADTTAVAEEAETEAEASDAVIAQEA
ncbi:MAG: 30S ribosomal protein S2 [Planctomycetes bacterium]|nr:30S ribosomal protein S2 [Planctomycetota bacterium]